MSQFFQTGPRLGNQYQEDRVLRQLLHRLCPEDVVGEMEPDLIRWADRTATEVAPLGRDAETHPPVHVPYDPWGRRIDQIDTSRGWVELDRISAEEGLVAIGYERKLGPWSRLHQFAKLFLFQPDSAVYTCPLAMTDGAARLIEVHGDLFLRERAFARLTSREPARFWTSGQWMTERTGGSDVGGTSTVAQADGAHYRLFGTKWFTSATTSQIAMTLARVVDAEGQSVAGSRGLSLFYLETRRSDGSLNGISIHRLKDKLGTKALPTAELTLEGTTARMIGQPGEGVKRIVTLVNVTRVYNSICAVAGMRRMIALARDYARRRTAFGKLLSEQPLHLETLAEVQVEYEGALALVLYVVSLMGREECGEATPEESAVLRILTPIAKLYTAKQGVAVISELLESFGGAGYVEDTGLPVMLRDAQVLSIWEGTTNVLSLDVLRSMAKEGTLPPLLAHLRQMLARSSHMAAEGERMRLEAALDRIEMFAVQSMASDDAFAQSAARGFAYALARTTIGVLLHDLAQWQRIHEGDPRPQATLGRWCQKDLTPFADDKPSRREETRGLALDEWFEVPSDLVTSTGN